MNNNNLPSTSGVSLKVRHYEAILNDHPSIGWFEIHPGNYMGNGGPPHRYLTAIGERYPLSVHGVGLSLGSADGINTQHLQSLLKLIRRYQPARVSEHLAWSHYNNTFHNDLLPLPYNDESMATVVANIMQAQDVRGRSILVENPSSYLEFRDSTYTEPAFLAELTKRTDCGILLDVNNIYVSACNQGFDPSRYLDGVPWDRVGEIHLAGHAINLIDGVKVRIDDHGSQVSDAVWALYEQALRHLGRRVPVLTEWDTDVPALEVLLDEAAKADAIADQMLPLVEDAA